MKIPYIAQISVLTLIVIVGVFLLIAMAGQTATIPNIVPAAGEVSLEEAPAVETPVENAQTTPEPEVILGDAVYNGFDATIAQGNVIDSISNLPLAGLEVNTYCNGKEGDLFIGKTFTDADGFFKIDAQDIFNACDYGTKAWFGVEYNGYAYSSPEIDIPETHIGGGSRKTPRIPTASTTAAHMPEFSATTLALAVLGSGLVLAMFRKK